MVVRRKMRRKLSGRIIIIGMDSNSNKAIWVGARVVHVEKDAMMELCINNNG